MITLALTTSTPHAGVALLDGDRVLASASHDDPRGHAERLFALVDEVLSSAGRARRDLELVACDVGPGSFTGVRIAVSSAKGIALALGLPLVGVSSLEALAAEVRAAHPSPTLIAAAIDARKDELYLAVYDGDAVLLEAAHVPADEAAAHVARVVSGRPFVSVVDAAAFAGFAPGAERALVAFPDAARIARLASSRAAHPSALRAAFDAAELVPLYVRPPDAIPTFSGAAAPLAMLPPR